MANQRGDGNGFGLGESKIVEHPAVRGFALFAVRPHFDPRRLLPERQPFASLRMKIVAQPSKLLRRRDAA